MLGEVGRIGTAKVAQLALKALLLQVGALNVPLELCCCCCRVCTPVVVANVWTLAGMRIVVVFESLSRIKALVAKFALESFVWVTVSKTHEGGLPRLTL